MTRGRPAILAVATVLTDAATVFVGAFVLWSAGGLTVVSGPTWSFALCGIVLACGFAVSGHLGRRSASAPSAEFVLTVSVSAIRLVVLAGAVVAWSATGDYFLGWVTLFAAVVLFVTSTWSVLGDVLSSGGPRTGRGRVVRRLRLMPARATIRVVGVVAGALAVVLLQPIHVWELAILSPLLVIVTGSVLLAVALRAAGRSAAARTEIEGTP